MALITGASGGIGAALARVFVRHGHDVALVARSAGALAALADALAAPGRSPPIVIVEDLALAGAADRVAAALEREGARVAILVNNAGFGLHGEAAALDRAEQLAMVDLNGRAVLDLTFRFLPQIVAARGKILNVGSIVGFFPGPGMAVYYASKAFLRSFSLALGEEMRAGGVGVSLLHPGLTATGFQARAGTQAAPRTGLFVLSAEAVAAAGYRGLMRGRRTVVPGWGNKLATLVLPLVPDALLLPLVARAQRRRRRA